MVGPPGHFAYGVAKGGVAQMTRQIAVDYGRRGIIANAVAPGKILTRPVDEPDSPEVLAYSHARTPFARLGQPGRRRDRRAVPGLGRELRERHEPARRRWLDGVLERPEQVGTPAS